MAKERELKEKFWKALKSDKTVMLGLAGEDSARPMAAQFEVEGGPIWFFTAKDTEIVQRLTADHQAIATFASKSHDLFATIHGILVEDMDRKVIDRLWTPFVAAWFEKGKDDPKLVLPGSTRNAPKSGSTRRASWPASSSCSASIRRRSIATRPARFGSEANIGG